MPPFRRTRRQWALLAVALGLTLAAGTDARDVVPNVRGPAFSDPEKIFGPMAPDWVAKPIRHAPVDKDADLVISLDQQMYPALTASIERYAKEHNLKIVVYSGTCGISQGKLLRKEVEIGGFCCPPGEIDRLPGLRFHTLGIAAIALITHPDNTVNNLSFEDARKIFRGDVYRWEEIKIEGALGKLPLQPIARLHCKVRPGHWRLMLANEDLFSPRLYEVGAIPDMIARVAANRAAIGYETLSMIQQYNKNRVKILTIEGHHPSNAESLIAGKYPMYRTYNVTTWHGPAVANPIAERLVQYLHTQVERLDPKLGIISPSQLRQAGWQFKGDELVGEPGKQRR